MHKLLLDELGKIFQVTCACTQLPVSMMAVAAEIATLQKNSQNASQTVSPVLNARPWQNVSVETPTANSKSHLAALSPLHTVSQEFTTMEVGGDPSRKINIILYLAACTIILALFVIYCVYGIAKLIFSRIQILEQTEDDEKETVISSDLVIFCND
jgi:hypothetical protein